MVMLIVTSIPVQHMRLMMRMAMNGNNGGIYGSLCFYEQFVSENLHLKQLKEPCLNVRQMLFKKHTIEVTRVKERKKGPEKYLMKY